MPVLENSGVKFPVPLRFRRGALRNDERASVNSAVRLLKLIDTIHPLEGARILDYGCGVKVVQGLLEIECRHKKYVGVDVYREMIDFLRTSVRDDRFSFASLDFHNAMYKNDGHRMTRDAKLPISDERFDILCMFSVITHMVPDDTAAALSILRRYAAPSATLILTAFFDPQQKEEFIDSVSGKPLLKAIYRKDYLERLIADASWTIRSANQGVPRVIQQYYVCSPS
jgi:SAM-dependent methyltransferase